MVDAIVSGRILPGTILPSQRALAASAGTSRSTVAAALSELSRLGWVEPRRQARFVARLPDASRQPLSPRPATSHASPERARIAAPAAELNEAVARAHSRLHEHLSGDGRTHGGLGELRQLVADRYTAGGLPTQAEQVAITNGAMGAFDLTLASTRGPVAVEDPTYHGALELLRRRQRRTLAWHSDSDWNFDDLDALFQNQRPAMLYAVADFHNPTGRTANGQQRAQLAEFADRSMIVIDETLRDLNLEPGTTTPPHTASYHPAIVTIGGLSKTIWSGLRIGWLRFPDVGHDLLETMVDLQPVPIFEQLVAIELWDQLGDVTAARRRRLRQQRDAMSEALTRVGISHQPPQGGLVYWVDLGQPVADAVATALNASGHASAPGTRFSSTGSYLTHIRLPFTADVDEIDRAVAHLSKVINADHRS